MAKKRREKDDETDEKLERILHPSTQAKKFKITLEFGYKTSPAYKKAVELAKKTPPIKKKEAANGYGTLPLIPLMM